ncbi:MAG: GDP-fucose synthetase [Candidatus Angelobacter sp. Gp1-AA117]|nr:MAG: GDP-fucose synthetase [Candidatus Angelobacter sp. Gp1-AA117]
MNKSDKIYVAGHTGLAGSAILRRFKAAGFHNLVTRTHGELDLMEQNTVAGFFAQERPQHVILAAARVGGILANDTQPAEFIRENLLIQTNVIHEAYAHGVKSLLFLGSSCIYPRDCPQPIREEYFLTGPLEKTNFAYAVAKIAGVEMCHAYNRQYGTSYICVMPTNLYGSNDHFDLNSSHVLPTMVRKFHEGKLSGRPVVLWGTGAPRREFLHADDMADACLHILVQPPERLGSVFPADMAPLINVGCGEDLTIKELAKLIAEITGYQGKTEWDRSKPDGTPRKLLDVSRMKALGWQPRINLRDGIREVYERFQQAATVNQ